MESTRTPSSSAFSHIVSVCSSQRYHTTRSSNFKGDVGLSNSPPTSSTTEKVKYDSDTQTLAKWLDVGIVKRKGRAFDADTSLIHANEAISFPVVRGYNLDGNEVVVPDNVLASAKLVCFSIKHYGFTLVRSWCDPFVQRYGADSSPTIGQPSKVQCAELCFVEYGFLSMAKNVFAQNLKSKVLEQQHQFTVLSFGGLNVSVISNIIAVGVLIDLCVFGDASYISSMTTTQSFYSFPPPLILLCHSPSILFPIQNFSKSLELPNKYTGYAYLLDKNNKVRWRGCGQAEPHELEILYKCTDQLVAEAEKEGSKITNDRR